MAKEGHFFLTEWNKSLYECKNNRVTRPQEKIWTIVLAVWTIFAPPVRTSHLIHKIHTRAILEPYLGRTCSVHSPVRSTSEWRKYGVCTEQVRPRQVAGG